FLRAAVAMEEIADTLRLRLVVRTFPRPMRRGEMQAHEERLPGARVALDHLHGAIAEQVGHVAVALDRHLLLVELAGRRALPGVIGAVIEIVGGAAEDSEEVVVAALERAEVRQIAEVPLADQRSAVARRLEERRQRGMARRQADVLRRRSVDRFLQA